MRTGHVVQTVRAGTQGVDLEQAAGHGDVLQEVEELVLIAQGVVEDERRNDREDGQRQRGVARAVADDQQRTCAEFQGQRAGVAKDRERKADPQGPSACRSR
jgi:hypothetical protein